MMCNRLILKLAALNVISLFAAWYHAQWELVDQILGQLWALRQHVAPMPRNVKVDAFYPSLLVISACLLGALYLATLRRNREDEVLQNMRRFQEAGAHARGIDRRLASVKVAIELSDSKRNGTRSERPEPLAWGLPPGIRKEDLR